MAGHVGMPRVPVASPFRRLSLGAGNGTRPRTVTCQPLAGVRGKAAVAQRPPRPALADRLGLSEPRVLVARFAALMAIRVAVGEAGSFGRLLQSM